MNPSLSLIADAIYEGVEPSCTQGILLSTTDRYILWFGGGISFFLTLFLIIGAMVFKRLRDQPGDLIVGIALSDFILSIHWLTLSSFYESVDDPTFCKVVGSIGTLAGATEFLYNAAFSVYLVISLRNSLKQSKIPKVSFHVVSLGIAIIYLGYLLAQNQIGKTVIGTCSISEDCNSDLLSYFGAVLVLIYGVIGFFTYFYVKKNAPQCQRAHTKRTVFLLYYLRYILACITVYFFIELATIATTILSHATPQERQQYSWVASVYNVTKLCSPLVLTSVRLNDPKIKAVFRRGIFFWRKGAIENPNNSGDPLINAEQSGEQTYPVHNSVDISRTHNESGILISGLNKDRKIEMTYTLLSCVAFSVNYQEVLATSEILRLYDRKDTNKYKHERIFLIDDYMVADALPSVQRELERVKYNILPGTLKVYSPDVFDEFVKEDKDYLNILDSIDFVKNKGQIRKASETDGGKSGELFFFSKDQKLIIKTIPDEELKILISILERYEGHFKKYPLSLIAKIYGAYTYENSDLGIKVNLIAMKNICGFPSKFVERRYDMKGSKYDRKVVKRVGVAEEVLKNKVLKDSDFEKFEKRLFIDKEKSNYFLTQIEIDSMFLRSVNLIDYSFMVYIVDREKAINEGTLPKNLIIKNALASVPHTERPGIYYHMGIIDYLQPFNFKKSMERFMKKLKNLDPNLDTSSQDPEYYSIRFIQFMNRLIKEEAK